MAEPDSRDGARASSLVSSNEGACRSSVVLRSEGGRFTPKIDDVIQEYTMRLYVNGELRRAFTCSPWDVEELVTGSLFCEGAIERAEDMLSLDVDMLEGVARAEVAPRVGEAADRAVDTMRPSLTSSLVSERMALLESGSRLFHRTGGVHSAALAGEDGIEAWFEDIGRHSALDKLVGWCVMGGIDVSDKMLLFSGRVPHEIIAKAARLGLPVVVSPGAPTSLSIRVARESGITLIGFAKNGRFNVYTHPERFDAL